MKFKIGDHVLWRSPTDSTNVAKAKVESVSVNSAVPFGIRTNKGTRMNVPEGALESESRQFGRTLVVGDFIKEYCELTRDFSATFVDNKLEQVSRCDLIMFTGGEDVTPAFYGAPKHKQTFCNPARDSLEARVWNEAKRLGIPCVGICRGGQFLNVMNGGRMVQHITRHTRPHDMYTHDGRKMIVSSTHHQLMDPGDGAQLLCYAKGLSEKYEGLDNYQPCTNDDTVLEPEVLYYETTNDLCVQYHPEMMDDSSDGCKYFTELLKNL